MWPPRTAADVDLAVENGLEESHSFDAKLLPAKNKDIAIDVCAMTVDGGMLLYGVGEDERKRLTVRAPFDLGGVPERIDQIVATSIMEPPTKFVRLLELGDNPSRGYVLVEVPASPRAPHQVIVGKDFRYYGRDDKTNRILTEGEVGRLYERRQEWSLDAEAHLDSVIEDAPVRQRADVVFMHAFARPIGFDRTFLRRQITEDEMKLRNGLVKATNVPEAREHYQPKLSEQRMWSTHGAEGIAIGSGLDSPRAAIQMSIRHDGETRFFSNGGERRNDQIGVERLVLFDYLIAGNLGKFLSASGFFFDLAGYIGPLDIGVAITNTQQGISYEVFNRVGDIESGFPQESFRRTERVLAHELAEPKDVAMQLLRHFYDATVGFNFEPLV